MKQIHLLLLTAIITSSIACKKSFVPESEANNKSITANIGPDLTNYTFFGQDDFNGTSLDTSIWNYRMVGSLRPNEVAIDSFSASNVTVSNGHLYLKVDRLHDNVYSAAMISTESHPQYHFRYGYFEIRAKLPQHFGNVSAFWLQSQHVGDNAGEFVAIPDSPSVKGVEIDIFEYGRSTDPTKLYHTLHWNGYYPINHKILGPASSTLPSTADGYHIIGLEWTPSSYTVYVDGNMASTTDSATSHVPEFILLSIGTGGFGGNPAGGSFPDNLDVDYVKVYKRNPSVTVFEQCLGLGWVSQPLLPGSYTTAQLAAKGVPDNQASSIQVPEGWQVTIYDGDNFTGASTTITSDVGCSPTWNDRLSSMVISVL